MLNWQGKKKKAKKEESLSYILPILKKKAFHQVLLCSVSKIRIKLQE